MSLADEVNAAFWGAIGECDADNESAKRGMDAVREVIDAAPTPAQLRELVERWRGKAEAMERRRNKIDGVVFRRNKDHYDSCISQLAVCIRDLEQLLGDEK